jgi:hypothetical protein
MIRREGAPLKVAVAFHLPAPGEASDLDAETVDPVFRDLQDEIVLHLGKTWPTLPTATCCVRLPRSGRALVRAHLRRFLRGAGARGLRPPAQTDPQLPTDRGGAARLACLDHGEVSTSTSLWSELAPAPRALLAIEESRSRRASFVAPPRRR